MKLLLNWLMATVAVMALAYILPGVEVSNWFVALVVAIVLGLINAVLRPILIVLTLPINILTLGLLTFVIDGFLVLLAARLIDGFVVTTFWWALLFALLLGIVNSLFKQNHRV
ncbi:MAG: phage holin family protein [Patescibacteria group bacterium]